jgi:hypothetical protein
MLFACQVKMHGTLALAAAVARKTPEISLVTVRQANYMEQLTKVSNANIGTESHHRQTDESEDTVGNDPWRADLVLVTSPREANHDKSGEYVGWSDKTVASSSTKTHSVLENNGKEISNGVCYRGGKHEDQGKAPHLKVHTASKVLSEVEFLGDNVVAVLLDSGHDEVDFILFEELLLCLARFGSQFWKINDVVPSDKADNDSYDSLEHENPSPS